MQYKNYLNPFVVPGFTFFILFEHLLKVKWNYLIHLSGIPCCQVIEICPHPSFIITSCSKTIGLKQAWWSVAICLLLENKCLHGTDEAWAGSMWSTMHARVGNDCEWLYTTLIISSSYKLEVKLYYLPPFNKISVLSYIMFYWTKIMVQFWGPTLFSIVHKEGLAMLVELRQFHGINCVLFYVHVGSNRSWAISVVSSHLNLPVNVFLSQCWQNKETYHSINDLFCFFLPILCISISCCLFCCLLLWTTPCKLNI